MQIRGFFLAPKMHVEKTFIRIPDELVRENRRHGRESL